MPDMEGGIARRWRQRHWLLGLRVDGGRVAPNNVLKHIDERQVVDVDSFVEEGQADSALKVNPSGNRKNGHRAGLNGENVGDLGIISGNGSKGGEHVSLESPIERNEIEEP